jgi:hypothetical protein
MAAAAAILIRKEKDIVDVYRRAGATSPAAARTPDDLGVHHRVPFSVLVRRAVLLEVSEGRYYLDEPRWQALRAMRRRIAMSVVALVIVIFIVLAAIGVVSVGFGIPRLH